MDEEESPEQRLFYGYIREYTVSWVREGMLGLPLVTPNNALLFCR